MKKSSKLLFSAAMCVLLTIVLAVAVSARIYGDVDEAPGISVTDARIILRFAVQLDAPSSEEVEKAADIDKSGKIDVNDARKVLRMAVSLDAPSTEEVVVNTCSHDFVKTPVMLNARWSSGKHIQKCSKCGLETGVEMDCKLGDIVYNNGIKPNCKRSVNYTQTCTECGGVTQGSVKKLPHNYTEKEDGSNVEIIIPASCTSDGKKNIKCINCNSASEKFTIHATGHKIPDRILAEGETVRCDVCNEDLQPANFNFEENEFLIYASGKYYYEGVAKTIAGSYNGRPVYELSNICFAVDPGQSLFMQMELDGAKIGYLTYIHTPKIGKPTEKKYFHTFYEGKNYYLDLSTIASFIGSVADLDELGDFPSVESTKPGGDFNTAIDHRLEDAEMALVVYEGKVCTRFTFDLNDTSASGSTTIRVYMDGQKLLLIEKLDRSGTVVDATYFYSISSEIPEHMRTATGANSASCNLLDFANYIGILE